MAREMEKHEAVRYYGRNTEHQGQDGCWVTNEWIAGTFAGRGFCGRTFDEAAHRLVEYLDQHIGHDSVVGMAVDRANWTLGPRVRLNEGELRFQSEGREAAE